MDDPIPTGLEAMLLIEAAEAAGADLLHVASGERRAEALVAFLAAVLPGREVVLFPPWDCLPYDSARPSAEAMGRRMAALHRLAGPGARRIVVAPPRAVLQRLPPPGAAPGLVLREGARIDADAFRDFCLGAGYWSDGRIDEPGEFALRGATIEIFPAGATEPCRVETAGDSVESIRSFDPATQLSREPVARVEILPVTELPPGSDGNPHRLPEAWPQLATLPDHLREPVVTALPETLAAVPATFERIAEAHRDAAAGGRPLPPDALYLTSDEWAALTARPLCPPEWRPLPAFAAERRPRDRLARFLQARPARRMLFPARSPAEGARVARMVRQAGGPALEPAADWIAATDRADALILAPLDEGVETTDLALVTAVDLLGRRAEAGGDTPTRLPWTVEAADFAPGDLVVHEDHGLARLDGVEPLESAEVIRLVFAGDKRLLVPVRDAGRIWRYGPDEGTVRPDRLGGPGWPRRRAELLGALDAVAARLAAVAVARERTSAPRLDPPRAEYERLAARFPYPLTPDQATGVRQALQDLASGRPMNRLVIGDVGFGKTEVALRAAAAAALAGAQVVVAAPTTVLARQHFHTFRRRFAGLGIQVGHLSRLVTGKAAAQVREGLASGRIRIVVGTHALAGKGVRLANPGLLVIDEEQRFGAADKQKLRRLGEGLHVLSMSATPIPRTLQAALVGLQDLTPILTPPARRRPVRTLLAEADDATFRQALVREHHRGGQSFVVVPRVEDIAGVEARLRTLLPALSLKVAHGGLPARVIDATMVGFAEGEGDVLLATSIIESGLDVARANTMLVLRPALFGLGQLHQLRGRVGRGALQGYCYLMAEPGEDLGEEARKRLGTLQALDRLGAGMALSAADLDRRGAGDLLGDRQAGHVRRVGLGLYQELLAQTLCRARGGPAPAPMAEVQGGTGAIPADHIPEPELRINLYHRIARAGSAAEVERLSEEIADRFGPPPPPLAALLAEARIRVLAGSLGVERVSLGPEGLALTFAEGADLETDFRRVIEAEGLKQEGRQLILREPLPEPDARIARAADLLERLA